MDFNKETLYIERISILGFVTENPCKFERIEITYGVFKTISNVFILEIFTIVGTITSKLINLVFISHSLINSFTFSPYKPKIGVRNETILVWYLGIKIIISFKCNLS
jgi:hypothetical protein